jgi:hypothetical protein
MPLSLNLKMSNRFSSRYRDDIESTLNHHLFDIDHEL